MIDTAHPPSWATRLLKITLAKRSRETILGDLLEEYRDTIASARGERHARWWYVRQTTWYAAPLILACVAAATPAVWNLYVTATAPLEPDTISGDLLFIAPMLLAPIIVGFVATQQFGYVADAARIGLIAVLVMIVVGHVGTFLRINLFLDVIQYRDDWTGLLERYHASGFGSLRAYANYEYLKDMPVLVPAHALVGTALSTAGGAASRLWQRART